MDIVQDIKEMLEKTGWTQARLAQYSGISKAALSKFLSKSSHASIVNKLIPFVYGDKRPPDLPEPPAPLPKKPRKKKPSDQS